MKKQYAIIKTLTFDEIKRDDVILLSHCLIKSIDLLAADGFRGTVVIENSIIDDLQIHSCWFTEGLVLRNCVVHGFVQYEMGGHNYRPFVMEGNVFTGFVDFSFCQFLDRVIIRDNVFMRGTNLLGNQGEKAAVTFETEPEVMGNAGKMDLDVDIEGEGV